MSKAAEATLIFAVAPSGLATTCLHACYLSALSACWLNGLAIGYRLFLIAVLSLVWLSQAKGLRARSCYLRYTAQQGWSISFDGGNEYCAVTIKSSTVVGSLVTFLHYATEDKAFDTLVIWKDALTPGDYRRLIVKLKLSDHGRV